MSGTIPLFPPYAF